MINATTAYRADAKTRTRPGHGSGLVYGILISAMLWAVSAAACSIL